MTWIVLHVSLQHLKCPFWMWPQLVIFLTLLLLEVCYQGIHELGQK